MSTQPEIPKPDSKPLEQYQQFSSLQPKHTRRQMRQYVLTDAELNDISLLNTITNWCFSAASGTILFVLGLAASAIIEGNLTEKGVALLQLGIPVGLVFAILFSLSGILALRKKRSVLSDLKQQSLDIDQMSLVSSSSMTQPTPSTPDNEGSQTEQV